MEMFTVLVALCVGNAPIRVTSHERGGVFQIIKNFKNFFSKSCLG